MKKICFLLVALLIVSSFSSPAFSQEKKVEFTIYSDPENKFYLQVPKGWMPADQKSDIVVYIIVETPENKPVNSLNVQKIPVSFPGEEQPKEAINMLTQQLQENLSGAPGFTMLSDNFYTINGQLVRVFDVEYDYEGAKLRQTQAVLYQNGNLFAIIYTADTSVYNEEIFTKAVDTFKGMS